MSIDERTVRNWLPVGAVIVVNLITLGIAFGLATARLEAVEVHAASTAVHMPYAEKIKQFPTRVEFDAALAKLTREDDASARSRERIEDKVDKIYEILTANRK
jgi:hypothetical protein